MLPSFLLQIRTVATMWMIIGVYVFAVGFFQTGCSGDVLTCDSGWISYGSYCYLIVNSTANHTAANGICKEQFAKLTSVWWTNENKMIAKSLSAMNSSTLFWIGLYLKSKKHWLWRDGTNTSRRFWASGEPQAGGCVAIDTGTGKWVVKDCNETLSGYICKRAILAVYELGEPWRLYANKTERYESKSARALAASWHRKSDSQDILMNMSILRSFNIKNVKYVDTCFMECLSMKGACIYVQLKRFYTAGIVNCKLKKDP